MLILCHFQTRNCEEQKGNIFLKSFHENNQTEMHCMVVKTEILREADKRQIAEAIWEQVFLIIPSW